MSSNIFSIASEIFSNQAQDPKSIQFILDQVDYNTIFELLVLFLLEGISIKFDNNDLLNFNNLTKEQLYDKIYFKFREYFISLGFNIYLNIKKFEKLNFRNSFTFFPEKLYTLELCTLFLYKSLGTDETPGTQIFIEYNPTLTSKNLQDYILIIPTTKYLLEIRFDFFYG